jgi:hypothetical protein
VERRWARASRADRDTRAVTPYDGRVRLPALLAVLVWLGCSYSSTTTRRVALLGYAKPPRIALVTKGPADLVKPWSAGDLLPRLDTARLAAGIAAGVRWPRGRIHPVAFGELGLGKAYQGDAASLGGYFGAGAGIEVWLAGLFAFADVRWRRFGMQRWEGSNGGPMGVVHPDLDTRAITAQAAIGRVF